ncbi:DHA2 family efflux MFS transporter permease subunit [Paenibacillus filicis]|uniref:DHA2 family efflux MFS transporter permease subunit n=1 Tax=Paenibacillus gyeongsangnamensis TaxID=3388067 RepID=A0ABT4QIP5_9BACL|nr:DHA2 family efflux MFS transporter permease subunit [Paenibacillus filicis]MCZ8516652.1 DHA2 family efflux MFS transporter permease subunit [Paenibacillus filicis]
MTDKREDWESTNPSRATTTSVESPVPVVISARSADFKPTPSEEPSPEVSASAVQAKYSVPQPSAGKVPILSILAIIIAVFMAILDTSIVNVAIPKMMAVFGVTQTDIQWVLTAYTLVVGALVPVTGYLGDRLGYKKVFLYALVIFTIGSGLCGAAWSNGSMIVFRIIQAIGGGALMPVSMAMMFRMFPPERRGFAMGMFGIAIMFAPALGPTLSGYIVEYSNWRLIFYINLPIGVINFFLATAALKETQTLSTQKFDLPGFLFSTIGFSTLLYGLGEVASKGWSNPEVVSFLIIAVFSLTLFVIRELTTDAPMMDLRLLANYTFTIAQLLSIIATVVLMGGLFIIPIFLQNISGLTPLQTGLVLLPQAVISGIMMPIAGYLFDKIGARPLAFTGLAIAAYSLYLNHFIDVNTSNTTLIGWFVLRAVGIGFMMMPVQTAGMNTVPMNKIGQGTAITNTVRQVAASFGIAWMALLLSQRTTYHAATLSDEMNIFSPTVANGVNNLQTAFAASGQSTDQAYLLTLLYLNGQLQTRAVVQAMDDIFIVTSILAAVGAAISLLLRRSKQGANKEKNASVIIE